MHVKQGQVVVTLEHQDYIRLQQDYLESKTQLEFLEQEYKRQEELARENVNAAKVLQQALSNYNSAKAKEEGLRAQIKMIGLSAETIQKEGIKSIINITTPIAGYVTEVNVNRGKFVNSADVMFKIVDTDHLHAEAQVFEGDIMKLRTGQTMKLKLANETEERIATIYLIGKEISAERTVRVHGHLEKEDPLLIPGMYFAATIETGSSPVPALPEAAVVSYDGVSYIFIQKATNEFGWVEVETGISESGFTHVILPADFDRSAPVVTRGLIHYSAYLKMQKGMTITNLSNSEILIYILGFIAQSLFGARTVVQWVQSERAGRVVSPTWFWIFSLSGSILFLVYGLLRKDVVILVGQTLSFYIYVRNLQLKQVWSKLHVMFRIGIVPIPFVLMGWMWWVTPQNFQHIFRETNFADVALLVGGVGQLLLNLRYLYQWYFSEKARQSLLPLGFWIISAVASLMVVYYGIRRNDPVLLTAQSLGFAVYLRNIWFALHTRAVVKQ
ncbi:MAG: lipid-A-disaccharide synthase N-terminal domain-containing protein [Cyclobacteriaceae bacterium]|nr:MAG: lipid-A-disaccharide synthase N-terminal domain-containing protein [Cyclobacteriaceae bacterium]